MKHFPAFLNFAGQRVVVAGGGDQAVQKARLLAAAGANLLIVAESVSDAIKAEFKDATILERRPTADDFAGALAAIIADADDAKAEGFAAKARAAGALINAVDRPELSDFITPSIIDRGDVVVAVSTSGAAPVLARRLRQMIEALLPARLGALAHFADSYRPAVAGKIAPAQRRTFWERFFDGPIAAQILAGDARGVPEAMIEAINRPTANALQGVVHIVGAGPGDPELLTLRAHRLLQDADVILHDRLVSDDILSLARRDAVRVFVGKAKGDHSVPQEEIAERLVAYAREGKTVVRLKGGDPFVFGRGGEELDAVKAAGISVFVTPGITAATGCSASAGMALTHRDHSQAVTFVTGHAKDDGEPDLDWNALAKLGHTLVVYMGVGKAAAIAQRLINAGRASSTPVAVIENGTLPDQRILKGVLENLTTLVVEGAVNGPAILVIGEVAAFADGAGLEDFAHNHLARTAA